MENAVSVNRLTVSYGDKPVLWDVNMEIPKGKLAAVIGPNGAGKSTLLKAVLGLIPKVSGDVQFFGEKEIPKNTIGYVPQSESVDWDFPATVSDVVLMGRYGHLGLIKRPRKLDKEIAAHAIELVGMTEYANRQIKELSGGQQQRVFLARALAQQADIYFMDEPFKGVDVQTERAIVQILKNLKEEGKTVIVVHHDLQTVKDYFDWVTLLNVRLVANGEAEKVFDSKNVNQTYNTHILLEGVG
ncbi:metal ABC transporter ATP-binding protein [Scatolibacter rhodanostii]|uniref:metal ABC transporter ATP-binding protein n=1 Tax=Scatolibacter rhodanostii TaxID=2014781 RepID=UPI000C08B510|nr:ABC transporter ATP-binding protein [Scatolibacter rhodanostii]